jgi:hypothetical protein
MSWIVAALIAAVGSATSDVTSNRLLSRCNDVRLPGSPRYSHFLLWALMLLYPTSPSVSRR